MEGVEEMILPQKLMEDIVHLQERCESVSTAGSRRIAVFDLDNTLLDGDIGNALYASLLSGGSVSDPSWEQYKLLMEINPRKAYEEAVKALEGFSIQHVIALTREIMQSEKSFIEVSGDRVPVPAPNPAMKELIRILRATGFIIYVISASNDVSVKVVASEWFNIPAGAAFGIRSDIQSGKFTRTLQTPVPVGEGKIVLYRQMIQEGMPLIVASDNAMDLPLLQMCDPYGIAIIVGNNEQFVRQARAALPLSVQLHVVSSSRYSDREIQCMAAE
jgi:phosphoserine phosphatase